MYIGTLLLLFFKNRVATNYKLCNYNLWYRINKYQHPSLSASLPHRGRHPLKRRKPGLVRDAAPFGTAFLKWSPPRVDD